jgi:hypothetical protein
LIENLRNSNPSSSSNPSSNPSFSSASNLKSGCASGSEKVDKVGKVKSFSQYRKLKGSEWEKKVKGKEKDKADDVINIFIGLLQWRQLDRKLKPARGKRIALRVSNEAPYAELCTQALLKWKAYQSNIYDEEKEYYWFLRTVTRLCSCLVRNNSSHSQAIQRGNRKRLQTDCFVLMHQV